MLKARYDQRGPVPEAHIEAVTVDDPLLQAGQARVAEVVVDDGPDLHERIKAEVGEGRVRLAKRFAKASREQQKNVFEQLTKLIATGKLQAKIEAGYDVAHIKEAVAAAAAGERTGKILIVPGHD